MSSSKTEQELNAHKEAALRGVDSFISSLIQSGTVDDSAKADKFCYWLEDYIRFLKYEPRFHANSLKRYKRGEIVKVHLGFNIGSEEGGLHYAVVLDKNNSVNAPVLTVVPLTSVKPTTDLKNLHPSNVYLGNEIFTSLSAQIQLIRQHLSTELSRLRAEDPQDAQKRVADIKNELRLLDKMNIEIGKMKKGSIALVGQVTTISKIRIYDPRTNHDVLSRVRLSTQKLDAIDAILISHYTGRK